MKIAVYLLATTLCLIESALAVVVIGGSCPDLPTNFTYVNGKTLTEEHIDRFRLVGSKWYEAAHLQADIIETYDECVSFDFKKRDRVGNIQVDYQHQVTNKETETTNQAYKKFDLMVTNSNGAGWLTGRNPSGATFWADELSILMSDYENYFIMYSCKQFIPLLLYSYDVKFMTKTATVTNDQYTEMRKWVLKNLLVDKTYEFTSNNTACPSVTATTTDTSTQGTAAEAFKTEFSAPDFASYTATDPVTALLSTQWSANKFLSEFTIWDSKAVKMNVIPGTFDYFYKDGGKHSDYLYVKIKNVMEAWNRQNDLRDVYVILDTNFLSQSQISKIQKYNSLNTAAVATDVNMLKCCVASGKFNLQELFKADVVESYWSTEPVASIEYQYSLRVPGDLTTKYLHDLVLNLRPIISNSTADSQATFELSMSQDIIRYDLVAYNKMQKLGFRISNPDDTDYKLDTCRLDGKTQTTCAVTSIDFPEFIEEGYTGAAEWYNDGATTSSVVNMGLMIAGVIGLSMF